VSSEADGTTVLRNKANRNGANGIEVDSSDTTLTRNRANFNRWLGIDAVEGVTDGGDNKAKHNGDPAQCLVIACK
jgi:parallel beta-helix repeat protein